MPQSNPQDFRWSLIEHPQATAMTAPEDQWVTFRQPVRFILAGTFADGLTFNVAGTGTTVLVNTAVVANGGTDKFGLDLSLGNIGDYAIFNFVSPHVFSMAAFGTHFFAVVPSVAGTNMGTYGLEVFGSHTPVVVLADAGTSTGTFGIGPTGSLTLVVMTADAGTNYGTFVTTPFGIATQVTVHAGTYSNPGTFGVNVFGAYTAS